MWPLEEGHGPGFYLQVSSGYLVRPKKFRTKIYNMSVSCSEETLRDDTEHSLKTCTSLDSGSQEGCYNMKSLGHKQLGVEK